MEGLEDEEDRSGHASSGQQGENKKSGHHSSLLDGDLASLKRKFPWLADFSDTFIRGQSKEALLKMETTSMKMKMMERKQDFDENLASNKMELTYFYMMLNLLTPPLRVYMPSHTRVQESA